MPFVLQQADDLELILRIDFRKPVAAVNQGNLLRMAQALQLLRPANPVPDADLPRDFAGDCQAVPRQHQRADAEGPDFLNHGSGIAPRRVGKRQQAGWPKAPALPVRADRDGDAPAAPR